MAIIHGLKPKKTLLPIPSFYGYEYAIKAGIGELLFYPMKRETKFCLTGDIFSQLTEEVELFVLGNPNNPTGLLPEREFLREVLYHCKEKGIFVVLDECFIEFCKEGTSLLGERKSLTNVLFVRAFTKSFSLPGVRLGYLVCENQELLEKIRKQLPEWNTSVFAQAAGCQCAREAEFLRKTREYLKREREFLTEGLRKRGIFVYPSDANFLLLYSEKPLYEKLLRKGILIRDCENFRGMGKGFYRIAVKTREENEILLEVI
jgi:histidinol-phosphate/aromatic aminotransferase/cobyric acid decarboxylase-like protein